MKALHKDQSYSSSSKRFPPYTLYCLRSLIKRELNKKNEFTLINTGSRFLTSPYASFKGKIYQSQSHPKHYPIIRCPVSLNYHPSYTQSSETRNKQCAQVQSFELIHNEKKINNLTVSTESSFRINANISRNYKSSIKKEQEDNVELSRTNTRRSTLKTSCCLKSSKDIQPKKKKLINKHHFICEAKAKVKHENKTNKNEKKLIWNKSSEGDNFFLRKYSSIYHKLTFV